MLVVSITTRLKTHKAGGCLITELINVMSFRHKLIKFTAKPILLSRIAELISSTHQLRGGNGTIRMQRIEVKR